MGITNKGNTHPPIATMYLASVKNPFMLGGGGAFALGGSFDRGGSLVRIDRIDTASKPVARYVTARVACANPWL